MVRGIAQLDVVEGVPPEYLEASKKQISADQWQTFEAQVRQTYRQMAEISITPEWARVFDFVTRAPSVTQGWSVARSTQPVASTAVLIKQVAATGIVATISHGSLNRPETARVCAILLKRTETCT